FGLSRDIFYASWGGDTIGFDGLPRPRTAHESSLDWMDDKGVILKKFRKGGIPVPRGGSTSDIKKEEKVFWEVVGEQPGDDKAVIVKPAIGSRSRHTYMHITDVDTLRRTFKKAQELSPRVVVEEELSGFVFRVTLVGGKIAGIMRREPANVIADGVRSVRKL